MQISKSKSLKYIRAVAILEAVKGIAMLIAGLGALSFMHRNVDVLAEQLVAFLHLNPVKYYPHIFLDATAHMTNMHLILFALLSILYATVRLVEAYGLWYERRWAEWIAAISGAIYIPFELYELIENPSILILLLLAINMLVVVLMVNALKYNIAHRSS